MADYYDAENTTEWVPHYTAAPTTALPDYVCCVVTEGVWTWFSAFLLTLVLFAVATLRYYKKSLRKHVTQRKDHDIHLRCVLANDRGAVNSIRQDPISVPEFPQFNARRRKHKIVDNMEYRKIMELAKKHPITMAKEEENLECNQNQWSVPFDYNRVSLVRTDGLSDYVNASRIKNYRGEIGWIITQGPTETTVQDLWQLIWQENVSSVVMLTRTFEFIEVLCVQYWPFHLDKPESYGEFTVIATEEECFAHYKVRTLVVGKGQEWRRIKHFHFLDWNCYSNPAPYSLLQFRRRILEETRCDKLASTKGPPLVHCHDGGSRSGNFVAIIDNLAMAEDLGRVDVFGTARRLLEERRGLISCPDQLTYIYDVIEDHLLCGEMSLPLKEILPRLQAKSTKSPIDKMNAYQREHKLLCSLTPRFTIGDCAAGHRAENHAKNRNVLVVPPDKNRPYLTSLLGDDATDYVNAVFVDGFHRGDEFICTEWPLARTIPSFWTMVYDHDIRTIVVLNHPKSGSTFPSFWPAGQNGKVKDYGPDFCVEQLASTCVEQKFASWELKLMKQEDNPNRPPPSGGKKDLQALLQKMRGVNKTVHLRLFQILCWPSSQKVPNSTYALVHLIDEVEKWRGSTGADDRVLVVSTDGYSRIGVYCVAAASIEQVRYRQEVDVFQAVKAVRKNRPQMVANATEYKYCYDVILHYVMNYCRKA